jgi:Peptidase M50B-like
VPRLLALREELSGYFRKRLVAPSPSMSWLSDDEPVLDDDPPRGLTSFEDWRVRVFGPWALIAAAALVNSSPLGFFLRGFHVWIHEFGHATAAWMSGYRATPLPIGWANIELDPSRFVYFGGLFLCGVFAWAGWTQRRLAAVVLGVTAAIAQFWMTWRNDEFTHDLWIVAGGVGGEFYLSTACLVLFFVRLPAKFRWGVCRWPCGFVAASGLLKIGTFWWHIRQGREEIPFGSMLHGEEDPNGDMNRLIDDHGWTQAGIIDHYSSLGVACLLAWAMVYVWFALRADLEVRRWWGRRGDPDL